MEHWDVYDGERRPTGRLHHRGDKLAAGDFHLVVHVWITDSGGQILLSKRHPDKPLPNLWECVGGSVLAGESSVQGALRETKEEIGIDLSQGNGCIVKNMKRDDNFCDVWLFRQDVKLADIVCGEGEVTEVKWVTKAELTAMFGRGELPPSLFYFEELPL